MFVSNSPLPNPYIDLKFPFTGYKISLNHSYPLYSVISHQFPVIHNLDTLKMGYIEESINEAIRETRATSRS
jgi:hypothetical protein